MNRTKHILILSGGGSIGDTYPSMIKKLQNLTDVYIISNDLNTENPKESEIITEFDKVKAKSEDLQIAYHNPIFYKSVTIQAIIDEVIKIYTENPTANYSFNITGGTKIQAIALYRAADLMDADTYYVMDKNDGDEDNIIQLTHCRLPAKDIGKNPNLPILLNILAEFDAARKGEFIPRVEVKTRMKVSYVPIRGERKTERMMREGTLTAMFGQLVDWNLVEESQKNKREKMYRIRGEGKIMLKMYQVITSDPKKKR